MFKLCIRGVMKIISRYKNSYYYEELAEVTGNFPKVCDNNINLLIPYQEVAPVIFPV